MGEGEVAEDRSLTRFPLSRRLGVLYEKRRMWCMILTAVVRDWEVLAAESSSLGSSRMPHGSRRAMTK